MATNSTFNANAFEALINELMFKQMAFNDKLDVIKSHCGWAADNYRSEDSDLANACDQIYQTVGTVHDKVDQILSDIRTELTAYMNETLANESATSASLKADTDALASADSTINSL